ncbi:NUDIX hydrolase [Paenibacillus mesotrionivorans]|uniref:NUDIX hydrolase n=1 Tax=Paenibacillus mesotrionivorans TaxID=3160968 RepID=A0ACC7NZ57_9BACL
MEMAIFKWHDGNVPDGVEIKQVYGLIFSNDGRLLLRVENNEDGVTYSLPGGHPEENDNGIEGTVRREIFEEVNITIRSPVIVGYQEVDEEDGQPHIAQVRMTALINGVGVVRPDLDNGKIYDRILVSPNKAVDLLGWGDVGYYQIKSAMSIAIKYLGISEFHDKEEYI